MAKRKPDSNRPARTKAEIGLDELEARVAALDYADCEKLIMDWLGAKSEVSDDGRVTIKHVEPSSEGEQAARIALYELLRSGRELSPMIRERLANLFNPSEGDPRELVIKPRRKGKQPNLARDIEIALDLKKAASANENSRQFENAVADTAKRYRVTRPTVWRAWKAHRDWLFPPKKRTVN